MGQFLLRQPASRAELPDSVTKEAEAFAIELGPLGRHALTL